MRAPGARPIRGLAWLCALGLATWDCALGRNPDPPRHLGEDGRYRVVVAPLNLAFPLPLELEGERTQVFGEVLRYYLEQDAQVAIVAEPDAIELWQESAASTSAGRGRDRLDAVARSFVRALDEYADFDLVVLPALVLRRIPLRDGVARWDGVRRRLRVRDSSPGRRSTLGWNRKISALSLYAQFVTRGSGRVSEGRGGIALLQEAVLGSRGAGKATLAPSREGLHRSGDVAEGVARALASAPLP